jgi:Tol biopolymer transport system component/DNA-binding winged helix-turn-helix (wHTH) protein
VSVAPDSQIGVKLSRDSGEEILASQPKRVRSARFDTFEVDFAASELRRADKRVPLQEQPFQLLRLLLEAAPEVVTREQIIAALWPPDTFVDFDLGVNTAIRKLRQALDDSVDRPKYIQTLAKKGYRFIAPVEWGPLPAVTVPATPPVPLPTPPPAKPIRAGHGKWIAAAIVVLAVGVLAWLWPGRPEPQPVLNAVPWNSLAGSAELPSFSPDGQMLTFQWDRNERPVEPHAYVQAVNAPSEPLDISRGSFLIVSPVWSPDGKWIAWGKWKPKDGDPRPVEIVLTPAPSGGSEIVIARVYPDSISLAWSPDSRYIAFADHEQTEQPNVLFLFDRSNAQVRRITSPSNKGGPTSGDVNAVFSPEGKTIAFIRCPSTGINEVRLLDLTSGKDRLVWREFSTDWRPGILAWHPDHKSLVYVSDRTGISRLWRVPLNGGEPQALTVGEDATSVAVSESAHRLAFTRATYDTNIWRADIQADGTIVRTPIVASSRRDEFPQLSPDESKIAFISDRSGFDEIWVANADGSNPVQLSSFQRHKTGTPRWSPDGQEIAFDSRVSGNAAIYVVGLNGGAPRRVTSDNNENLVPAWSPDGKWIYFSSSRTGGPQIWRMDAAGKGPAEQVTKSGGLYSSLTSDGKTLYYSRFGRAIDLCAKTLPDGEEPSPDTCGAIADIQTWQLGDHVIYFGALTNKGWELEQMDPSSHQVHPKMFLSANDGPGVSVSRDGKHVYYTQVDTARSNIMLVENFR